MFGQKTGAGIFLGTIHCVITKVKKRPGEMNCALKYLLLFADEEGSLGALVHAQMNYLSCTGELMHRCRGEVSVILKGFLLE